MWLLVTKGGPTYRCTFWYSLLDYICFNGMHWRGQIGPRIRDTEGTENRDTHSNMASWGWGMAPGLPKSASNGMRWL